MHNSFSVCKNREFFLNYKIYFIIMCVVLHLNVAIYDENVMI